MHRAIELSLQSVAVHGGGPFGAVVVKDGVIVGGHEPLARAVHEERLHVAHPRLVGVIQLGPLGRRLVQQRRGRRGGEAAGRGGKNSWKIHEKSGKSHFS